MTHNRFRTLRGSTVLLMYLIMPCEEAHAVAPVLAWSVPYNSAATNDDAAYGVAVDGSGNIVVVGFEYRTDMGQKGYFLVKKYDPGGNLVWTRTDNANSDASANDVAIDASGNIAIVGVEDRTDIGQSLNWMIRKYDPNGNIIWSRSYDSPGHSNDFAYRIAVDTTGNCVAVGYEFRGDIGHLTDWCINKYDVNGSLSWSRSYHNPSNKDATAYDVATDASGNIAVVGYELRNDLGQSRNWLILKYDSDGNFIWSRSYDGPMHTIDESYGVAMDASGNVVVAGGVDRADIFESVNLLVRKYDPAGNLLWEREYNSPYNLADEAFGVTVDNRTGDVVVVGWEHWNSGKTYWFTRKYDTDGNLLWHLLYSNPNTSEDSANDVAVDASGNVIVAGQIATASGDWDWMVLKYVEPGNPPAPSQPGNKPSSGEIWVSGTSGKLPVFPVRNEKAVFLLKVPQAGRLRIKVFSLLWEEVATVFDGNSAAGPLELLWNGRNKKEQIVAAGTYLVRFNLPGQKAIIRRLVIGR